MSPVGEGAVKCLAVFLVLSIVAGAQEVPSGAGFDVISIKQNVSGAVNEGSPPLQHGRLRFTNFTVQGIMSLAFYPLDFDHIKGAPGWTSIGRSGSHYDIEAITEERGITGERYHQMLRAMLVRPFRPQVPLGNPPRACLLAGSRIRKD